MCIQRLALCTSAVMYMMSRDHLTMHIDASSLQLMLQLLSIDSATLSSDDDDFCRTQLRLHGIVQQAGGDDVDVTLDNMTVSCFLIFHFIHSFRFEVCF